LPATTGRPTATLTHAVADELRERATRITTARGEVERQRDEFARFLRRLRADGVSISACARHLGLSRQYLYDEYLNRDEHGADD